MSCERYNTDCMTFMRSVPDGYFDLTIADPPYGIGLANNPFRQRHERKEWDGKAPDDAFFRELFRVSRHQIIWGGNYFALPPNKHFLIWDKVQPFDFSSAMCEYAWSSFDKPAKMFRYRVVSDKGKIHPTQKPVALYEWILRNYAQEGWRVFDPMMGSGSSAIAAYHLGFDYVGCEVDRGYFVAAEERFKRECFGEIRHSNGVTVRQLDMFGQKNA